MKRTTLRTSAIALGVAAALPATGQEWNFKWGGFIHQHVAFGSSEVKRTGNISDKVFTLGTDEEPIKVPVKIRFRDPTATLPTGDEGIHSTEITGDGALVIPFADDAVRNYYLDVDNADIHGMISRLSLPDTVPTALPTGASAEDYTIWITRTGTVNDPNAQIAALNKALATKDYNGSGMHSNTEVHFMPSITLDSGLTFGATIEFEGDKEGVDQSFISVSSESLGTLKIGKHGKTGLGVGAPSVGIGINSGDHHNFIRVDKGSGAMSGTNTSIIGTSDRISYTTPKNALAGFEFGISYAPGGDDGNRTSGFLTKEKTGMSDNIDVAMKFEQPFGDASFALGMRYGTAKEEGAKKKPRNFGVGASVGFGGFTFGGSYADVERDSLADSSSGWNLGASYNMEAWTFGIETYQGEADDGDKHSASKIAASWKLHDGVHWDFYAVTASSKHKTVSTRTLTDGRTQTINTLKDASGNAFGTAINLSF
ncbi:MAG: porin [Roseovarius sp.]|nr:porin [Roseovarius sp.]